MYRSIIYKCIAISFAAYASNGELLRAEEQNLLSEDRIILPSEQQGEHGIGKVFGSSTVMGDNFIYIGGSADYPVTDYPTIDYFSSLCDVLTFGKDDATHSHAIYEKCLDLPRSTLATVVLNDDTMLVFGGSTEDGSNTDTVDVLTFEKQPSGELALHLIPEAGKIGVSKSFVQAVSTKNAAYVVGGIHDIASEATDIDCFYLTSSKDKELKHKKIKYNNLRLFHALVATDDKIFIAGGMTYTFESDLVEVYSENKHYFSGGFLTPMHLSAPRVGLTGTGNNKLLIFAGGAFDKDHDFDGKIDFDSDKNWKCADAGCLSSHVDIYNLKDGTWSVESLSEARVWLGSSSDERYFVFAGGLLQDEVTISSKFDVYDSTTGLWEVYEMPVARHTAEVGIVNSRVFVAGGVVLDENKDEGKGSVTTTSRIDIFDLKTKQWLDNDYINYDVVINAEAIE